MGFFSSSPVCDLNTLSFDQFKLIFLRYAFFGKLTAGVADPEALKKYISSHLEPAQKLTLLDLLEATLCCDGSHFTMGLQLITMNLTLPFDSVLGLTAAGISAYLQRSDTMLSLLAKSLASGLLVTAGAAGFVFAATEIFAEVALRRIEGLAFFLEDELQKDLTTQLNHR